MALLQQLEVQVALLQQQGQVELRALEEQQLQALEEVVALV